MNDDKKIILIIGASGSGKTTLGDELEKFGVLPLISFTTRKPRPSERYAVDYYFETPEEVEQSIWRDDVVEMSEYDGNTYGLYRHEIDDKISRRHTYFVCDKNGARQIMDMYPDRAVALWLDVSVKTMIDRMTNRGDTGSSILQRVYHASANEELDQPEFAHARIDVNSGISTETIAHNIAISLL